MLKTIGLLVVAAGVIFFVCGEEARAESSVKVRFRGATVVDYTKRDKPDVPKTFEDRLFWAMEVTADILEGLIDRGRDSRTGVRKGEPYHHPRNQEEFQKRRHEPQYQGCENFDPWCR